MYSTRLAILLVLPLAGCVSNTIGQPDDDSGGSTTDEATTAMTPPPPPQQTTGPMPGTGVTTAVDEGTSFGESSGGGTAGEGEDCELEEQNCAEGLKCMPYSTDGSGWWNDVACFPVDPGHVGLGEPCEWDEYPWSGYDNCGPAAVCWDLGGEEGECKGLCQMEIPGDWDTLFCEAEGTVPYVGCQDCFCICETPCDPLAQDCGEGQGCYPTGDFFICGPDASTDEQHGSACEFINVCGAGLACINADSVPGCEDGAIGCCATYCNVEQFNACPGAAMGEECVPWFERGTALPGLEHVGVCSLPM